MAFEQARPDAPSLRLLHTATATGEGQRDADALGPSIADPARLGAMPRHQLLRTLQTSTRGLTEHEAEERALRWGENALAVGAVRGRAARALSAARDPFVLLLVGLAVVAIFTGSTASAAVIAATALTACVLRAVQEHRGERAVAALRALVGASASVVRRAADDDAPVTREIPIEHLVPGDIVELNPGDLVPADLYLLRSADLTLAEGALTGESRLTLKTSAPALGPEPDGAARAWLCPAGGQVAHGTGTGVVIATGPAGALGAAQLAASGPGPATAFERSVARITRLLVTAMAVTVVATLGLLALVGTMRPRPLVFALAAAVGLIPEMLPVVTTGVSFAAARALGRRGIAVRRLAAMHDLGAMDTLCLDKTGTLTAGRPTVTASLDAFGGADPTALRWARAVSAAVASHAPGLIDAFDDALLADDLDAEFDVLQVLPFDSQRRLASALVREPDRLGSAVLVTHGAVPEVLSACTNVLVGGERTMLTDGRRGQIHRLADAQADQDARLLAVAIRDLPPRPRSRPLRPLDERGLTLVGFVALRDQAAPGAAAALAVLVHQGIDLKVITGDVPQVAAAVCAEVGLEHGRIVTGAEIDRCDEPQLAALAASTQVFAQATPAHKARIVTALRETGRVTGFLGDGVNDAPALRAADVALAPRGGADLARECADVVLGPDGLSGLADAVATGRRAAVNAVKYLKIAISANAGNALSILIAALVLPFPPMLPVQILVQNLAFDLAQLALATDRVEPGATAAPRRLAVRDLCRFALVFAPINTLADLATFHALSARLAVPGDPGRQALFHAGWLVENLLTQACAIYLLRTRRAGSRRERASGPLLAAVVVLAGVALLLPLGTWAAPLSLAAPPAAFYPYLAAIVAGFCVLTAAAKSGYARVGGKLP